MGINLVTELIKSNITSIKTEKNYYLKFKNKYNNNIKFKLSYYFK